MAIKPSSVLNSNHPLTFISSDSHWVLRLILVFCSTVNRNAKDVLNPTITSWNKLCHPSASSSESSRSTHSTNTHPSVINTNEDSLEQDLPPTFSPTIPTHTFHESAPLDVTRFGLGLPISQHLQPTIQDKWASNLTDPIEQSSVTTDDQDHSNLFVTHPQLTHSPAALSSVLPLSPSSSLPPTGSQSSESISYPIQDSTVEPSEQAAGATPSYLFQSSHHSPTHGFHHLHHHPATRSVSNPNRSHSHHSLPLPSLIPPTPPSCTPAHLSHLISPPHPGLSLPPSPLPTPQSSLLYQHPLPSRSSFAGPPPYYYGPNGFHPSLIGSTSSSAYSSGNGYPSTFFTSPSPYQPYPNGSRSTSHGSPNLNPSFYGGMYYTSMSNKKQTQSKRRTSGVGVQANPSSSFIPPPRMESEGEHEIERLKNRLKGMRAKLREMEIERSRNERELEIARWRLECVGVEKSLEEIETQKAIHHFLERAERAESYLKLLEMKLSNPVSTPSTTSSVTHLVLTNKEEDGEDGGFLRDELELEIEREREREMEREMGMKLEMGLEKRLEIEDEVVEMGMKLIEKNIIMDENEDQKEENENENGEDGNDGNGNQKKWQIVKEFDVDLLEIELDE
ncbi:uncharacterized protein MELLADRAFT_106623 [Melampsora larici-populina 98AG31]|uniref:Uncharacterized protein n=1 Tax=Melampsora larici-populina (strain 98AG31 / pathotype 3-4-7) TaxID=747676 RepID=F4RM37_MELLP|nr:uncharacterized protein MELLADRAFT_106623 [Melampsora larici-populina 98AG31]EGG06655.1 hypothetical protein MELLADRAFT_106623 [Melampsora larici-populina 98AG31]